MQVTAWNLDQNLYTSHKLHHSNFLTWPQSNCYVDLWIELLNNFRLDPIPCLSFTLASDFEGDQWTFFKFPLNDLYLLYGIEVQELNVWKPLIKHIVQYLQQGKSLLIEVDAFFLPDLVDITYRKQHQKTTIAVHAIDVCSRQLGYFHNSGYYLLQEDDFDGLFNLHKYSSEKPFLPPYVEVADFSCVKRVNSDQFFSLSFELFKAYLSRRPLENPFKRFRKKFKTDLEWLQTQNLEMFNEYAFSNLRQCGVNYEYASVFLKWLSLNKSVDLDFSISAFEDISKAMNTIMLKTARIAGKNKIFQFDSIFNLMESSWEQAMDDLIYTFAN